MESSGAASALSISVRQPRIFIDKWRALAIVTLAYGSTAWASQLLFGYITVIRRHDGTRSEQATLIFAAVMGLLWLVSVVQILRRR